MFEAWGGACSGTGACSVTMSANELVTAKFIANPVPVNTGLPVISGTPQGGRTLSNEQRHVGRVADLLHLPVGGLQHLGRLVREHRWRDRR